MIRLIVATTIALACASCGRDEGVPIDSSNAPEVITSDSACSCHTDTDTSADESAPEDQ